MTFLPRRADEPDASHPTPQQDASVANLTAKADLILQELDDVVRRMSTLLRGAYDK